MKYFDAHAHVQFPAYDADRDAVLVQMHTNEVGAIMVGVDEASSRSALSLVEGTDTLYASVGLHPNRAHEVFDEAFFHTLALNPRVVAIGECGLDYYRPEDVDLVREQQKALFRKHITLAVSLDKPLIIHARPSKGTMDAYEDVIAVLSEYPTARGDIHFFVGGVPQALKFIEMGFTLSFTAVLTFTHDYDEVIRTVPLSSILAETDAPYVAPVSRRGTRNDPFAVIDVVQAVARIRGEDEEVVREAVLQNARRVFGIV